VALASAALPLLVAGLAACSTSAGTDATSASEESTEKQARDWDAALSSCLRDAGFDLDDPDLFGDEEGQGATVDWDAVGPATDACLAEVTDERGDRPVTEAEADAQADADAEVDRVRSCLEDHGVEVEDEGEGFFTPPEDVPQDVVTDCDAQDWFPGQGGDQ